MLKITNTIFLKLWCVLEPCWGPYTNTEALALSRWRTRASELLISFPRGVFHDAEGPLFRGTEPRTKVQRKHQREPRKQMDGRAVSCQRSLRSLDVEVRENQRKRECCHKDTVHSSREWWEWCRGKIPWRWVHSARERRTDRRRGREKTMLGDERRI